MAIKSTARTLSLSLQIILPLALTCLSFVALYYWLHRDSIALRSERDLQIAENFFSLLESHNNDLTVEAFDHWAKQLLTLGQFHNIALVDQQRQIIANVGLPPDSRELANFSEASSRWNSAELRYTKLPLKIQTADDNPRSAFVIVSVDQRNDLIKNYQALFFGLIILLGALANLIWFSRRFTASTLQPLRKLESSIDNILSGQHERIEINDAGVMKNLIDRLNTLNLSRANKDENLQALIDSATSELRESLESVEVQNIELDLARKRALELGEIKSDFLKKTSQDLRTPLNGVLGFADLLKKTTLNSDQREYISTIEESTRGMLAIVNDIQDFSRIESGTLKLENKAIDLIGIIEHTLILQTPASIEKNINLYFHYDQDIPSQLLGDPLRIQQLLSNLITSATRFAGTSHITIHIEKITASNSSATFQFNIYCDGRAAESAHNAALDSLNDRDNKELLAYSNADIGLSIARALVQHMRGEIGFDDDAKHGNRLWFRISLDCDSDAVETTHSIDPTLQVVALVYSNDDLGFKEITSRLSRLGISAQRARNFNDTLDLAKKIHTDWQTKSRYLPIAIIEAQTAHQTIDKIVLSQTIDQIINDFGIPTIVVSPIGQHENLQKHLSEFDIHLAQRPLQTHKFSKAIMERLGILGGQSRTVRFTGTSSVKILLVDDNPANVKLTNALLRDFPTDTLSASSGEEALELFRQHKFDLILMDIQLPDIDGYMVTGRMRELEGARQRTPIVALTAHSVSDNKAKLLLSGMDDYLEKPVNIKTLGEILERWVSNMATAPKHNLEQNTSVSVLNEQAAKNPVNISECLSLAKNDAELAKDMLTMLIDSLPTEKNQILDSQKEQDMSALHEVVHRLHGGACYCGVPDLRKACATTDNNLKNGNLENIETELGLITQCIDDLLHWHEKHDLEALFLA